MAQEKRATSTTPGDSREKFVAGRSAGCFHGLLQFAGPSGHIGPRHLKLTINAGGQALDKPRVRSARAPAQLMIQMANNKPPVPEIRHLMQERNRISPARDADEVARVPRKLLKNLQLKIRMSC